MKTSDKVIIIGLFIIGIGGLLLGLIAHSGGMLLVGIGATICALRQSFEEWNKKHKDSIRKEDDL